MQEVLRIDLGRGKDESEPTVAGWTDTQILKKSTAWFEEEEKSAQMVLNDLEKHVEEQRKRLDDWRARRRRREELGVA